MLADVPRVTLLKREPRYSVGGTNMYEDVS